MTPLYRSFVMGAAFAAAAVVAAAPVQAADYPQLPLDRQLVLDNSNYDQTWEFVAPVSGQLMMTEINGGMGGDFMFTSPDLTSHLPSVSGAQAGPEGYTWTFMVEEGESYYFHYTNMWVYEPRTFIFRMKAGELVPEIAAVYPSPSTTTDYYFADYPQIQIILNYFSDDTVFDGSSCITFPDASGAEKTLYVDVVKNGDETEPRWDIDFYRYIQQAKQLGLQPGSVVTVHVAPVTVDGIPVTGQYVDADGWITLEYLYGGLVSCIDYNVPSVIRSFYPEDSAEGVLSFTFDGELMPLDRQNNLSVVLYAGGYREPTGDSDELWPELTAPRLSLSSDSRTLLLDLRGVLRPNPDSPVYEQAMKEVGPGAPVPEGQQYPLVTFRFLNVRGANGSVADFNTQSAYIREFPFLYMQKVEMKYAFMVGADEVTDASVSLSEQPSVDLWVQNAEQFVTNGIVIDSFTFSQDGRVIAEVQAPDPMEFMGYLYTIPVPGSVRETAGEVVLSAVITSADGFSYAGAISATFTNTGDYSGVGSIDADGATARWFDLQGRQVAAPGSGLYIRVLDGRASKVLVR